MTLPLQEKRVNGDADQGERQERSEGISQMRDLYAPCDSSSQRLLSRALDRPSELAEIIFYPCKR